MFVKAVKNSLPDVNKFLWFSQEASIKICSTLIILLSIGLSIIDISSWLTGNNYVNYIIVGIIALFHICIIGTTIYFNIKINRNEINLAKDYKKTTFFYLLIALFQYFAILINEILTKFIYDETENKTSAEIFKKYKEKYGSLPDNEIKKKMRIISIINISLLTVVVGYIFYYALLIKTYLNKLDKNEVEEDMNSNMDDTSILLVN